LKGASIQTTIFYFSGTGNCLKIARDLAKELPGAQIAPIATAIKEKNIIVSGRAGFVFPIYAFGAPLIVTDFIDRLTIESGTYLFAIASPAKTAGLPFDRLSSGLAKKAAKLSAGFIILMPSNYTPFGGAIPAPEQEKLFAREVGRVKEIASIVNDGRISKIENPNLLIRFAAALIGLLPEE
jgi:hypothetical protein